MRACARRAMTERTADGRWIWVRPRWPSRYVLQRRYSMASSSLARLATESAGIKLPTRNATDLPACWRNSWSNSSVRMRG